MSKKVKQEIESQLQKVVGDALQAVQDGQLSHETVIGIFTYHWFTMILSRAMSVADTNLGNDSPHTNAIMVVMEKIKQKQQEQSHQE
jgi:hypothetical protein